MFGFDRRGPFEDLFSIQRDFDRMVRSLWNDLSMRPVAAASSAFHVRSTDEGWRVDLPIPGIDPAHVTLEVAGSTVQVRAEVPGEAGTAPARYEQSFTLPAFLDIDKLSATARHGVLHLTVPLRESVKPRRVQIQTAGETQRQLAGAAA